MLEVLRSNRGKMLIPIILAVVLIAGAVGGVCFFKMKGKKHGKVEVVKVPDTMIEMGEMVVNLADSSQPHYLKAKIVLQVQGATAKTEVDESMPKIRDAVIAALSARYFNELLTPKGKDGLKEAIKTSVNADLKDSKVDGVYFSDFAMQ